MRSLSPKALFLASAQQAILSKHMQGTDEQRHASDMGQLEGSGNGTQVQLALIKQPDAAGQLQPLAAGAEYLGEDIMPT